MSASNTPRDDHLTDTAAGNSINSCPLIVECGTNYPHPNFQFIIYPIEPPQEKKSKIKSRWLEKQLKQHGWRKK